MARTKLLDRGEESSIAESVIETIEEGGFSPEEIIPGLIKAAILLSEKTSNPEMALDEAANLLADGPSQNERW